MRLFRWIGHILTALGHLLEAALIGVVTLFAATLDFALSLVTRAYDRFNTGWERLGREALERQARGRRPAAPGGEVRQGHGVPQRP